MRTATRQRRKQFSRDKMRSDEFHVVAARKIFRDADGEIVKTVPRGKNGEEMSSVDEDSPH